MVGSDAIKPARKSPTDALLRRYADHLNQVQGLAPATVHYRLRYARTMLSQLRVRRVGQLKRWTVIGSDDSSSARGSGVGRVLVKRSPLRFDHFCDSSCCTS